ncbi:MAG: sigma-54 interaction domain-containing protein [Salibacteraceae bacterium]
MDILSAKQRFGIIGNNEQLNRAIDTAIRVAPTSLSVLVTGESGVGKESIPQIIHAYGQNKHNKYVAVNCGAIPEGTIDSELFGHVKGSFTGAHTERKGYFEEADGGTIFLDEIGELPKATQAKLLRILESGEFLKVGSSKVLKTEVRIVAATNVNIESAIKKGRFREDLYYRLNTVPILMPPLRDRGLDIQLLFRKFATDFAEKYRMPVIRLSEDAKRVLSHYYWPGNVRQLKNITEQLSILETNRNLESETLLTYLPNYSESSLPVLANQESSGSKLEKEVLMKALIEMRAEVDMLKKAMQSFAQGGTVQNKNLESTASNNFNDTATEISMPVVSNPTIPMTQVNYQGYQSDQFQKHEEIEESLSLEAKEKELIKKALDKHRGKRKYAAQDLGISERTLYRKIKEYELN